MKRIILSIFVVVLALMTPIKVDAKTTNVKNINIINIEEISLNEMKNTDLSALSNEELTELLYKYKDLKDRYPSKDAFGDIFEDIAREIANRNKIYSYEIKEVKAKCTFYDSCFNCCNKELDAPGYKITASGKKAVEGTTAALDKSIPFGSLAISPDFIDTKNKNNFNGILVKHDVGGGIKNYEKDKEPIYRVDIYVDTAKEDNSCGVFGHKFAGKKALFDTEIVLIVNKDKE